MSTNVMLVLDASSTVGAKRWASVLAGARLIKAELRGGDSMSVVTFNDRVSVAKFEDSHTSKIELLEGTKPGGGARLYDAVAVALHVASKQHSTSMDSGMPCITHVLVLTSSMDAGSAFDLDALKVS